MFLGKCGGGVARQLADNYKNLEKRYCKYCEEHNNKYNELKGNTCLISNEDKYIANMFSQKENFDTDYEAMEKALRDIHDFTKAFGLSICMPYGIGCGIANGNWNKVYNIIEEVFKDYEVNLYRLKE